MCFPIGLQKHHLLAEFLIDSVIEWSTERIGKHMEGNYLCIIETFAFHLKN